MITCKVCGLKLNTGKVYCSYDCHKKFLTESRLTVEVHSTNERHSSICALRSQGKSYNEISKILGISKSSISYALSEKTRQTSKDKRGKLKREDLLLTKRVSAFFCRKQKAVISKVFKHEKTPRVLHSRIMHFKCRALKINNYRSSLDLKHNFYIKDVQDKFSDSSKVCYLSGEKLSLDEPNTYCFDHIIPTSKGGSNELNNLGFSNPVVNQMKGSLSVEEFISWCKKVSEFSHTRRL